MDDLTYAERAAEVVWHWLPAPLAERIAPYAACLVNLSAGARVELQGDEPTGDDGELQRSVLHALALGHDWATSVTRTPVTLEEDVIQAVLLGVQPLLNPTDPEEEIRHNTLALGVLRAVAGAWQEVMIPAEVAAVLDDRARILDDASDEDAPLHDLGQWFDLGAAHAHVQRIVLLRARFRGVPWDGPTLDPIPIMRVLAPEIFGDWCPRPTGPSRSARAAARKRNRRRR